LQGRFFGFPPSGPLYKYNDFKRNTRNESVGDFTHTHIKPTLMAEF